MTLVLAVMVLLGRRAWGLPSWIDRITPDIDSKRARLPERTVSEQERSAEARQEKRGRAGVRAVLPPLRPLQVLHLPP
ncbi:hypothetical protein [Streptomyces sp. NPDC046862]|uniref:hypothetical protein n=1 Tax=Streptomyces sp. NPDC046862 TaxID=3154603 RepID=UPI00345239D3